MPIEQNVPEKVVFIGEDKKLRFELFDEDDETPLNATGMSFAFAMADDPQSPAAVTKSSPSSIRIEGVFNPNPETNTQYVEVDLDAEDLENLYPGNWYFSLRRTDVGTRTVLTFGVVPVGAAVLPASA